MKTVLWTLLILFSKSAFSAPEKQYYVEFFSWNGAPDKASSSHVAAEFLEVGGADNKRLRRIFISWLPRTGKTRPLLMEPGKNFSREETFRIYGESGLLRRGAYRIGKAVFEKAMIWEKTLGSGAVRYKMFDWRMRNLPDGRAAINCIHAVSDIAGPLHTGDTWGEEALKLVVAHFERQGAFIDYPRVVNHAPLKKVN